MFLLFALTLLIARPFTVVFHELGHAIPAMLLTRQRVSIYIGSYGDPRRSLNFRIGLLDIWFRYNPFSWRLGVCVPSASEISINRQIIYTITGPLASFTIVVFACYFAFAIDVHGFLEPVPIMFLGSSIVDLLTNLLPSSTSIKLHDGSMTYNDGYQIRQLLSYKKFSSEYEQAIELYSQQKFSEAALFFNKILKRGLKDENIYRLTISSLLKSENYKQAKELSDEFFLQGTMNSYDFANAGLSYSKLNQHDKAMELYDMSLKLNPDNKYSLNNKGFTLNLINRFEEAIPIFDKVIEIDDAFSHSYASRGLSKIKIGKTTAGLEDISYSLKLDEKNSYGYRNLGIYHLDKGEYSKALELFNKAKELDNTTQMIDELIISAKTHLRQ